MSFFFDNSITDTGKQLWAEMQAGGTFVPTKIVIGSGYLPTGKTTRTVTAVAEPVKTVTLNKKEKLKGGDFVFGGVFSNEDVETAFYYRELALFAKVVKSDGTETAETLYSYGNAGASAEIIPAYSTDAAIERQLDILTYIGNDATVNLEITTGIYVTQNVYNAKIEEIQQAIEGKADIPADVPAGKFLTVDEDGNIVSSGKDSANFAPAAVNAKIVRATNITVAPSAWSQESTPTISGYPQKAEIEISGIDATYKPSNLIASDEAFIALLAEYADTGAGKLILYASEKPAAAVTIDSVDFTKAVT